MNTERRRKILVVDDSSLDIAVISETLNREYSVMSATCAEDALAVLQSSNVPDLILLDILMPGLDGLEFCRRLRADPPTRLIPVIFVTSKDSDEDEAAGFAAGGVDYVTKPVNPHLLRARVRAHLELKLATEVLESQNEILKDNARLREEVEHLTRHDLKNPLMVILNVPILLMRRPGIGADEVKWLQMILSSAQRMLEIINMSTGMFKMEQGTYVPHPEPVDALAVARQIAETIARIADAGSASIGMTLEGVASGDSDSFVVLAEEPLLYTLLSNLMRNAVEASPAGGNVLLSFSKGAMGDISIHNSGAVPAVIRARFFQKFVTAGKQGGTGLGVYSAQLIARTLGGSVSFQTSEEAGTTLTVSLPLPDSIHH
jgi:two-component system, sensor histidine kinase and response regulator